MPLTPQGEVAPVRMRWLRPSAGVRPPRSRRHAREVATALAFLLPSLAVFCVFIFYPLYRTFFLSLHANNIIGEPTRFVGLDQFRQFFTDSQTVHVLVVTAIFTVMTVIPSVVIGLVLALLLTARVRGIGVFRTLMATPFGFSTATASVAFAVLYNPAVGVFNGILQRIGIAGPHWLTSTGTALFSVALVSVWMQLGYNVLVLSAGLQAIPDELYEAARIDGASWWRQTTRITLPLLTPSIFLVLVISTIFSLQTFGQIFILTKGGPSNSTTTLVYSIYSNAFAFGSSNFGLASAEAVVLLVIVSVVTAIQFGVLQRRVFYR